MDLGSILNSLKVTYDGRTVGGSRLRMPFKTDGNNEYAFYYDIETDNTYCNCSAYETAANIQKVREVANKYLKDNPQNT